MSTLQLDICVYPLPAGSGSGAQAKDLFNWGLDVQAQAAAQALGPSHLPAS